jgi:putative methyltransferase (TIGR04325 family)
MPSGWKTQDNRILGWNVPSVPETQKQKWESYLEVLKGPAPLAVNHEAQIGRNPSDLVSHNLLTSYAYVLALAAREKKSVSILDWGGGVGHYYPLSKAVLPGIPIDYTCQDLPLLCQTGREFLPDARFVDQPGGCFDRAYDLVLASSSLWYVEDWLGLIRQLAGATNEYLYLTRMLFVGKAPSFVVVQRPKDLGYRTEYLCWVFNQSEFVGGVSSCGMECVREFLLGEGPYIHRAPEAPTLRGFLFRRKKVSAGNSP